MEEGEKLSPRLRLLDERYNADERYHACDLGYLEREIRELEELGKITKNRDFISSLANRVVSSSLKEDSWCGSCDYNICKIIGKGYLSAPLEIRIIERILITSWAFRFDDDDLEQELGEALKRSEDKNVQEAIQCVFSTYEAERQELPKQIEKLDAVIQKLGLKARKLSGPNLSVDYKGLEQALGEALKRIRDGNVEEAMQCILSTIEAERQNSREIFDKLESEIGKLGFEIHRRNVSSYMGVERSVGISYKKNEQLEERLVSLARIRELVNKTAESNPLAKDGTSIDADKLTKRPVPAKSENRNQKIKR